MDIRRVQEVLIEKGFYHGKVDGVLTIETKDALIAFQRRQGIEATGRIDVRTSEALGVSASGRTEGRGDQDRAQGRSNARPATSGQANPSDARDLNGRNDNGKGNAAQQRNNERNNLDSQGQSTRPASGQGNSNTGAKGDNADKAAPSTSGQGTRPGESKPGESGKAGSSMRPQNQPGAGNSGASDNQRKQPQ